MGKAVWWVLGGVVGAAIVYLLTWPVPISPARWQPARAPQETGPYLPNTALDDMERLPVGRGPESVAVDAEGRIVVGLENGTIVRIDGADVEVIARIRGRPLGLAPTRDGGLLVCDLYGRLLDVAADGAVGERLTAVGGKPLGLVNAVDVSSDGRVYLSESSSTTTDTRLDLLEHRGNGRLIRFDPVTEKADVLLDGLYYANGVALSADESFVLVVETTEYRVRRLWLTGLRAGESETFVENLPGFPDGISCDDDGAFWLALVNPRSAFLDWTLSRPWTRRVAARLPLSWFESAAPRWGCILALDADGRVIANYRSSPPKGYAGISSAIVVDGTLYAGSLLEDAIGRLSLP